MTVSWLGSGVTWLGQEEPPSDDPAEAAGAAAKEAALKADWPPTRANVQAIGGAAGGAAAAAGCVAAGEITAGISVVASPLCAALGREIGKLVSGVVYDIIDGFFADEEYVAPQFDFVIYQRTREAGLRLAKLKQEKLGPPYDLSAEFRALVRWGLPPVNWCEGCSPTLGIPEDVQNLFVGDDSVYYSREGLEQYLQLLASAESARTAEIVARKELGPAPVKPSSKLPLVLGLAAAAAGIAWILLA